MRKTLAVLSATGAILFGGAGAANATAPSNVAPSATTTTLADNDNNNQRHDDNSGKWGLLGLLGLGGLAGLLRRDRHAAAERSATHVDGPTPRV